MARANVGSPTDSPVEAAIRAVSITPRRAATRQRLLTAAAEIFAERGMHGATVEDICEAAGFTRGAFYSNFADKEELFSALLRQREDELLTRIDEAICDPVPGGAPDVIDQLVEEVLAAQPLDRQSYLVHAEFTLYAIRSPAAARELTSERERFRDEIARLLDAGLARAGRRLNLPAHDAVAVVIATFQAGMEEQLMRDPTERPDSELARRALPIVIRALSEPL